MPIRRRCLLLAAAAAPLGVAPAAAARRTGALDAPEVVEWHSLTCPFCAQFVLTVWPEVERRLVRPGFLAVRFEDKDRAKALGARWDAEGRRWVAPAGADLAAFRKAGFLGGG